MPSIDFDTVIIKSGKHSSFAEGACLLELVAYVADEPFSDHPACVSPVLAAFGRRLNDNMRDDERQILRPYIAKLVRTVDPAQEQVRYRILCWAAVTEFAPAALRLVKDEQCDAFADQLEKLTRYDWETAKRVGYEARDCARRVRYQRWSAADAADAAAVAAAAAAAAADATAAAAADYAADYAAAAAAAADAAAADYAADYAATAYAARARIFDLALAAYDRAINCDEVLP
jgi:hypothetical protein